MENGYSLRPTKKRSLRLLAVSFSSSATCQLDFIRYLGNIETNLGRGKDFSEAKSFS